MRPATRAGWVSVGEGGRVEETAGALPSEGPWERFAARVARRTEDAVPRAAPSVVTGCVAPRGAEAPDSLFDCRFDFHLAFML